MCVWDAGAASTVLVHEAYLVDRVRNFAHRRQQPHRLRRVKARSDEVDHVPLRTGTRCPLQHCHVATERRDPVCQCQSGDSGPADHHLHQLTSTKSGDTLLSPMVR